MPVGAGGGPGGKVGTGDESGGNRRAGPGWTDTGVTVSRFRDSQKEAGVTNTTRKSRIESWAGKKIGMVGDWPWRR